MILISLSLSIFPKYRKVISVTTVGGLLEVLPVVKARKKYFSVVKINTRPTRAEQMQDFVDCWSRDAGQVDSRVGLSRAPSSCLRASKNANSKL